MRPARPILTVVPVFALLLLAPPSARAVCTANTGGDVTCTGTDADGYQEAANDDIRVEVDSGATVQNGDESVAIGVLDDSTVVVSEGGKIEASGDMDDGVRGQSQIRVTNEGRIETSGAFSAAVFLGRDPMGTVDSTASQGTVANRGQIVSTGNDALGVAVQNGTLILNDPDARIRVTGDRAIGVRTFGDGNTLMNEGTISAPGADASGVSAVGSGNTIENEGLIEGGSGGGAAVLLGEAGGNSLLNRSGGVIRATSGLAVVGGAGADTVDNRGRIDGAVRLFGGNDVFIQRGGATVSGALEGGAGTDTLQLRGDGAATVDLGLVTGFETLDVSTKGTRTLRGIGTLTSGTTLSGGRLGVDGVVDLGGPFTQRRKSALALTLSPSGGGQDRLVATGAATISGGRLLVDSDGPVADGQRFTLIEAGSVSGAFRRGPTSTAVLDFGLVYNPTTVELLVSRSSYSSLAVTGNQRETAGVLDASAASASGDFATVLGSLDFLDVDDLRDAFDQLGPEYYDAHTSTALNLGRRFTDTLLRPPIVCRSESTERIDPLRDPCTEQGGDLWLTATGDFVDRDGVGGHIDFDTAGGGLAGGVVGRFGPNLLLGAGIGFARSHIHVNDVGDGAVTSLDIGGSAAFVYGRFEVRGAASYGHAWHRARRRLDLGTAARAADDDFRSHRFGAALEGSAAWRWQALRAAPYLGLDYTYLDESRVNEGGAGSVNLKVDSRTTNLLAGRVGVRIAGVFEPDAPLNDFYDFSGAVWVPEIRLGYRRVFTDNDRDIEARFEGAPSGVGKIDASAQDSVEALEGGAGITYQPRGGMTVGAHYDASWGDRTLAHRVMLVLRVSLEGLAAEYSD